MVKIPEMWTFANNSAADVATDDAEINMAQKIPSRPDYLTIAEYEFILERDRYQCAIRDFCNRSGKLGALEYCKEKLDFDHHQHLVLGGDNSFQNVRLLCDSENRGRPIEPTEYWAKPNYWDRKFNAQNLRSVQRVAGYQPIVDDPQLARVVTEFRDVLLRTTTLMVGATGTGKALTMLSVLFAINSAVNARGPGRPRVKHVLWLTTEEKLRDMTVRDLQDDPCNLRLVDKRPRVRPAKSYTDISRGPIDSDVIVACPQSLWEVNAKNGSKKTEYQRRAALAKYDVIVFDECDFAGEQVQNISTLARHALKFALTASPPLTVGVDATRQSNFLSRMVLIAEDAVADYTRAVEIDGCLKAMPDGKDAFVTVAVHDGYESLIRGVRDHVQSGKADPSHPVYLAAIIRAILDADREEQEMMRLMPDDWYSPHVIVRLDRKEDIKALQATLPEIISNLYAYGELSGKGWEVCSVYEGHQSDCPEERDLAAKNQYGWIHPFLRAKNQNGRADDRSKRVLLMINIALRGLNNWPIQFVVDCSDKTSVAEETQFRGRGIRLPNHLAKYWNNENLLRFITTVTYVPESTATDAKMKTLEETSRFLHNMRSIINSAGFQTWGDIANTGSLDKVVEPIIDPTATPLTMADKMQLKAGLGAMIRQAPQPESITAEDLRPAISDLVDRLQPKAEGKRRDRAINYATNLIEMPGFRAEETFAPDERHRARIEPVRCPTQLKPKDVYSLDELIRKVENDPAYAPLRADYKADLLAGSRVAIDAVSRQLRKDDGLCNLEPPRVFKLNTTKDDTSKEGVGVLTRIITELYGALSACGEVDYKQYNDVAISVYCAAQEIFGVDNARNGGPLDEHAYHVEIMTRQRNRIAKIALGILAERGVVQNVAALGRLS